MAAIDGALERGGQVSNPVCHFVFLLLYMYISFKTGHAPIKPHVLYQSQTAKKKFSEVRNRMDHFYDSLRENKADPAVMEHVNAIGQGMGMTLSLSLYLSSYLALYC